MLMSHIDVVPVEDESKWDYPPFSGQIVDDMVYGRGSDDCKSLTSSRRIFSCSSLASTSVPPELEYRSLKHPAFSALSYTKPRQDVKARATYFSNSTKKLGQKLRVQV